VALLELAEEHRQLCERAEALAQQRDGTPAEVEATVARLVAGAGGGQDAPVSFDVLPSTAEAEFEHAFLQAARALEETETRAEKRLTELAAKTEAARRDVADWTAKDNVLAPLARAKEQGRWWTPAWWRASFHREVTGRAAEARHQLRRVEEVLAGLEQETRKLTEKRRQIQDQQLAERTRLVNAEVARRCAQLHDQLAAVGRERARLDEQWRQALAALDAETPRPSAQSTDAIRAARDAWQRQLELEEKQAEFAGRWLDFLRHSTDTLTKRFRECVNLVAAPTTALASDPQFGDSTVDPITFDVLLLVNAEQFSESEFLAAGRRARRWVLVADASDTRPAASAPSFSSGGSASRAGGDRRKAAAPRLAPFQRLWQQLHCDPRCLPYSWQREADARLCCRLRPISPEQRRWIESERVADLPDIELRIVAPPRGAPPGGQDSFLAEVVFPASMSIRQAKEYIFHELQELPVRARAHSMRWVERGDRVKLHLGDAGHEHADTTAVDLGRGVRELLVGAADNDRVATDDWHTWGVEFDRAAGFDRPRAEEWARRHLGARDLGRTVMLDVPQGIHPSLAAVFADVLFPDCYRLPTTDTLTHAPAVEFVSVPAAPARASHRNPRWTGGAGLELDLSDPRHRDRLPADLRARLGDARGLVNYLEAQAVVQTLEHLVGSQNGWSGHGTANGAPLVAQANHLCNRPASIGIVALYQAQAQLIRLMLERRPEILAGRSLDIQVGVPAAFRECEYDVVLLSLTRSHTHRAVTYGEGPSLLTLAMTRARGHLKLFGDPGTLARRAQWQGPLDHLDELASEHERSVIAQLLRYIQGQGTHTKAFSCRHSAPGSRSENPGAAVAGRQPTAESRA
jgi:hypothetical protein